MAGDTPLRIVAWVGQHVLPHEVELRGWLRRAFPSLDADDLVQEAYCRLTALTDVEHIRDPRTYLFQTTKNVVLEQIRRSRIVSIEAATGLAEFDEVEDDTAFSPERVVADRQMLARVDGLISLLSERGQKIFRLRKMEGVPQREIALRLGIPETTVENEVARGLRKILNAMTNEERASVPLKRTVRTDDRGQQRQD